MKKSKIIAFFLISILIFSNLISACSNKKYSLGTADTSGTFYKLGQIIKEGFEKDSNFNINVKSTAGSVSNLNLITEGFLDFGISQSNVAHFDFYNNSENRTLKMVNSYQAVTPLYTEACHIIVREDSGIRNVDELIGKNIGIDLKESGTEYDANIILAAYGLNEQNTMLYNLDYKEMANSLKNGSLDAFFCTIGPGSEFIDKLSKEINIKILSLDNAHIEKILNTSGGYISTEIPAGTYQITEPVKTVGAQSFLFVSDKVPVQDVTDLLTYIYDNKDEISKKAGVSLNIDPSSYADGITIPFHNGATNFFNEKL